MTVCAEFGAPEDASRALKALTSRGYVDITTHAPFPLTNDDAHAPRGSFLLGVLAFGGGLVALAAAYLVQWYANAESYPLDIGGRPAHAAPAFVPAAFESICLVAAAAVFCGFLLIERLPRLWQPVFDIDDFARAAIDRFWVVVEVQDSRAALERITGDLAPLDPLRIVVGEEDA
jgi:Alternative complex III, ActD subunit